MGNWMTMNMRGRCDPAEVKALRAAAFFDWGDHGEGLDRLDAYGPLSVSSMGPGLCGIGDWPGADIDAIGNAAERDFGPDDVVEQLERLVKAAPSLELVVHCGGEYESLDCVATIKVLDGEVTKHEPEIKRLHGISDAQVAGRFTAALARLQHKAGGP